MNASRPAFEPTYFVGQEHRLTEREFEILSAVVRSNGASSKVLTDQLGLEEGSINAAMSKIYKKLDIAHTKAETISLLSKSRLFYCRTDANADMLSRERTSDLDRTRQALQKILEACNDETKEFPFRIGYIESHARHALDPEANP